MLEFTMLQIYDKSCILSKYLLKSRYAVKRKFAVFSRNAFDYENKPEDFQREDEDRF
jgi:hypothetical protein